MNVDMQRAQMIVDKLIFAGLVDAIHDVEHYFSVENWFHEHRDELNLNCSVCSGASKGVLIFSDTDWVIKFDYYSDSVSYCELEVKHYELAKQAGLEYYFAETRMVRRVGETVFTIQEKCECNEGEVYDSLHKYVEETDCRDLSDDDVWSEVYDLCEYGRVHYIFDDEALNSFISRNYINDLHQGNFGFVNGRLVMIDYSGFQLRRNKYEIVD